MTGINVAAGEAVKKRALIIGAILLGPLVFYLLVANVFLATPLLTKLTNRRPEKFIMSYDSAYTLWPGHVHVRGYHMVFQSYRVAFELDFYESTAHVALTPLFKRRFQAKRVEARGVAYRQIHRAEQKDLLTPRVLAFPVIAGVVPVVVGPPPAPPTPADLAKKMWSVRLDNVDSTPREVWIQEYRWQGRGSAGGSFEIRPRKSFWVGPAYSKLEPGTLSIGGKIVSSDFGGEAVTTLAPTEIVREQKLRMLNGLSVDGRFEGTLDDLAFLSAYGLVASGDGKAELEVHVSDGVLDDGTTLLVDLDQVKARHTRSGAAFAGSASIRAWRGQKQPRLHLDARGDVAIPLANGAVINADVPKTEGDLALTTNAFAERPGLAWFAVKASRLEAKDTQPLHAAMKGKVPFIVPALLGNGPLTARGLQARGSTKRVRLLVDQAHMGETQVRGELTLGRGEKPSGAFEAKVSRMPIGITVDEGKPGFQLLAKPGWLEEHLRGEDDAAGRDASPGDVPSR